jgi:hypothetical protein
MQYTASASQPVPVSSAGPIATDPLLGVQIGPDTSGNFALSISGLAVRRSDGRFVARPPGSNRLVDVTALLLPGIDPMVYRLPVRTARPGDLIVISDDPLTVRYVLEWEPEGELIGLDPDTGDVNAFVPIQVPFLNCFVRIVSLLDLFPAGRLRDGSRGVRNDRRSRRGGPRGEAHMELDELLLFYLLSGQQQQPGQTGAPNFLTLFLLMRLLGGDLDSSALLLLLLSGALQQPTTTTTPTPTTTPPQQLPANSLALLLALQCSGEEGRGGLFRRRRRRRLDEEEAEEEEPRSEREAGRGPETT